MLDWIATVVWLTWRVYSKEPVQKDTTQGEHIAWCRTRNEKIMEEIESFVASLRQGNWLALMS